MYNHIITRLEAYMILLPTDFSYERNIRTIRLRNLLHWIILNLQGVKAISGKRFKLISIVFIYR